MNCNTPSFLHLDPSAQAHLTRRTFLRGSASGLGLAALGSLMQPDLLRAAPSSGGVTLPGWPHLPVKAQRVIYLFQSGAPSQMDLFDPKPQLSKYHLQKFPDEIRYDNAAEASSKVFGSPWKFAPRGQCGMEISELLPGLSEIADDIS